MLIDGDFDLDVPEDLEAPEDVLGQEVQQEGLQLSSEALQRHTLIRLAAAVGVVPFPAALYQCHLPALLSLHAPRWTQVAWERRARTGGGGRRRSSALPQTAFSSSSWRWSTTWAHPTRPTTTQRD